MSDKNRSISIPTILLPVPIRLLGMALVCLCSLTFQHASAARADAGFVSPLDHPVVASQNESLRMPAGKEIEAGGGVDSGPTQVWLDWPQPRWAPLGCDSHVYSRLTLHPVASVRFVVPVLRAPPLI